MILDAEAAMGRGATRTAERQASALKLNEGASITFSANKDIKFGGVMLALPALLANGLLAHSEKVFAFKKGYYHLSNIFILLAFSALLRIKTIEEIKKYAPGEFGKILGLDRCPEIKTIQSKLDYLAEQNKSDEFSSLLSKQWLEESKYAAGILYVDGHMRIYNGSQTKLPKHFISRQRLCMPGIADYWVNDILGQPFFYVSSELNEGLINVLRNEIIPRLLKEVPNQPTDEELKACPELCRFTMVFDREGYSPQFLQELWQQRIAAITYKKYVKDEWAPEEFIEYKEIVPCGEAITMNIAERGVFLSKTMWVREIRKLTESNHQTAIITTNRQLKTGMVAVYMFARWSQENFFKYMSQHYGIDLLCEYGINDIPDTKTIVNPEYSELTKEIKKSTGIKTKTSAAFMNCAMDSDNFDKESIEKIMLKKAALKEKIDELSVKIAELKTKRKTIPQHIKIAELPEEYKFKGLAHKKKHILDLIKMIAYRSEVALSSILKEHRKDDSVKSFICSLFQNDIDIQPDISKKLLIISLHNLNNESSDESARFLCQKLNETETVFPGTDLRLFFNMVSDSFP